MAETQYYSALGAIYTTTGAPASGTNEVQTLTANPAAGSVTAGTFRLSFQGFVTSAINWSATSSLVEAALNALPSISGSTSGTGQQGVAVTGGSLPTTALTITFSGTNVSRRELPLIVLHLNSLTGGGTLVVAESVAGVTETHKDAPMGALLIRTDTGVLHVNTSTTPGNPNWAAQA